MVIKEINLIYISDIELYINMEFLFHYKIN